jgi:hypothetical protein
MRLRIGYTGQLPATENLPLTCESSDPARVAGLFVSVRGTGEWAARRSGYE